MQMPSVAMSTVKNGFWCMFASILGLKTLGKDGIKKSQKYHPISIWKTLAKTS